MMILRKPNLILKIINNRTPDTFKTYQEAIDTWGTYITDIEFLNVKDTNYMLNDDYNDETQLIYVENENQYYCWLSPDLN